MASRGRSYDDPPFLDSRSRSRSRGRGHDAPPEDLRWWPGDWVHWTRDRWTREWWVYEGSWYIGSAWETWDRSWTLDSAVTWRWW